MASIPCDSQNQECFSRGNSCFGAAALLGVFESRDGDGMGRLR